jgi:ankyrin repeat protein
LRARVPRRYGDVVSGDRDALLEAVRGGDVARVRELVERDRSLADARDDQGLSAVLVALYHRQRGACDALLAAGAELGVLEAAALGRLDVLRAYLESDQEALGTRSPEGFTLLHLAAFFGGGPAVRMLLAAGAPPDADADNPLGVRPLNSAAAAGDHDAARALLEAGADPNVREQGGFTPLLAAAHTDDAQLARLLLEHGADPSLAADDGRDPAAMAGERVAALLAAAR